MENVCPNCGAANNSDALFCEKCGIKIERPNYCRKCGETVERDMLFCPVCGASLTDREEKNRDPNVKEQRSSNKVKTYLIACTVIVVGIIFVLIMNNSKPNFQRAFEDAGGENNIGEWVIVSGDGKSLKIDTNPADEKDYYDSNAAKAIRKINKALGLPDSLYDKMAETRALDGRQTATYEKITVSWTYHPNYGLEIIYERK